MNIKKIICIAAVSVLFSALFVSCGKKGLTGHYKVDDRYISLIEKDGVLAIGSEAVCVKYNPEEHGRIEYRKAVKDCLDEYEVKYKNLEDFVYVREGFDPEMSDPEYIVILNGTKVLRVIDIADQNFKYSVEDKVYHVAKEEDKILGKFDKVLDKFLGKLVSVPDADIDKLTDKYITKFCKKNDGLIDEYELADYANHYLCARIATDEVYGEFRNLF